MQQIQCRPPSVGRSSFGGEDSNIRAPEENIIRQVNRLVKLRKILSENYNIQFTQNYNNEWSELITCPLPSHKGGNERTGSFGYNFNKDYFNCFGCGASGGPVEFISLMTGQDKYLVAEELAEKLDLTKELENFDEQIDQREIKELILNFASTLNKLYATKNKKIIEEVDKITWWFDLYLYARISSKKEINIEELRQRIGKANELLEGLNE